MAPDADPIQAAAEEPHPAEPAAADLVTVHLCDCRKAQRPAAEVRPYDFRHPAFLSQSELRRLRVRTEAFARTLSARLSMYLRIDCGLKLAGLQMLSYRSFVNGVGNPAYVGLFRAEPLPGICILEVKQNLGLAIVDRLLGGPADPGEETRDFTEIELALLEQAAQVIVKDWCADWKGVKDLRPVLLGHETGGRFLQTSPHDTVMLSLFMEARVGECTGTIQLGVPVFTLEPLIRRIAPPAEAPAAAPETGSSAPARWNPAFDSVPVNVSAAWEDIEVTSRDLAALKPGDILELPAAGAGKVIVRFAKAPRFRGLLGTCADRWAVQITETLQT